MAVLRPTLGHSRENSLTNPMLITTFILFRPEGHLEFRNEAGFISPTEQLVGIEPGTFQFHYSALTPLGYSYLFIYVFIYLFIYLCIYFASIFLINDRQKFIVFSSKLKGNEISGDIWAFRVGNAKKVWCNCFQQCK